MERPMKTKQTPPADRPVPRPRLKRILNLRLLLETLIVAAIVGPAGYFWYSYQTNRTAGAMLDQAQKKVAEKDDAAAAKYYFQYLKLKPGDPVAQVLLAEACDRAAKGPAAKARAVEYYFQALGVVLEADAKTLGVAPEKKQHDLRQRLAELLIELGQSAKRSQYFVMAEEEAQELRKRHPDDVQGCRSLALALYGQAGGASLNGQSGGGALSGGRDSSLVGEAVAHAWKVNPGDVEVAVILANIYRHQPQLLGQKQQGLSNAKREESADQVMDKMVAAKPKDAEALLAHHRYQLRYHPAEAKEALAAVIKQNPNDLQIVLQAAVEARLAAESAWREGGSPADVQAHLEQSRKHYEHALEISPSDERPYSGLADLYMREEKIDLAVKTLRAGLEKAGKDSIGLNAKLADVLLVQGQLDEADKTIAGLEQTAERIAPMQPQPTKVALKRLIDLLRGEWLASKGRYTAALSVLRRVAAGQPTTGQELLQNIKAWQWLGKVYAALGQWDGAATAYEQIVVLQPKEVAHHLQAAAAWAAADRSDAAEQHYRVALAMDPSAPTSLALARLLFERQLRAAKAARNWDSFDKALAEAKTLRDQEKGKKPSADAWRLNLLEANYLTARAEEAGQREKANRDALALCRGAEREYPDAVALLPPLAIAYEHLDKPADADRILKRVEADKDQAATACLLSAQLCLLRKHPEQARKVLTAGLATLPKQARPALRQELVQLALSEGRLDLAREQIVALPEAEPANLGLLTQLAEMAFETGKLPEAEQWEKQLHDLEGSNGIFWRYYRARRLLTEASARNDAKPQLDEVSKLQAFIKAQRPAWSRSYVLEGLLAEARGKLDQAAEAYQEAIHLGERAPQVYQRLISHLLQTNQVDEAEHYLTLMQNQASSAEGYSHLKSVVAAQRGQVDRALESARREVEQRPKDPAAQRWLGQLLLSAEKTAEAEAALKKAVELAPDDPRTLGVMFSFYLHTKRPAEARKVLQQLAKNEKLDKAQRALMLAQGYELLGDKDQANANYRAATQLDVENSAAKVQLAKYLLRTGTAADRSEAERVLQDMLDKSPDSPSSASANARQLLAVILAERGGEKAWQEARNLIGQAGKNRPISNADRRVQAIILTGRGGKENLDNARQILEELVADPKKADDADRQRLANLYEAGGNVEAARQQYLKLVTRERANPADVSVYINLLLRHDLFDEAEEWLKKLESLRPDDLRAAALRAGWLRGKGQADKIEPLLEPLAEKVVKALPKNSPEETRFLFDLGNLYSSLDQHKAAERWYRRLVAVRPKAYLPLVQCLAEQGRRKEAIELCREAAKTDASPLPAIAAATALLAGKPSAEDFALAEPLLSKAAADHKDRADMLSALANVRLIQNRLDEAIGLFRQALALKPDDVSTLNNLATLLAESPENRKEAIRHIDQAIEIAGPQPGLLDTKGMILVFENKPSDAVPLLEQAAASPLADPRYHFHLAVAYDRAGRPEKARAAFHTARKNHLARQILTPTDQSLLTELEKKFD